MFTDRLINLNVSKSLTACTRFDFEVVATVDKKEQIYDALF